MRILQFFYKPINDENPSIFSFYVPAEGSNSVVYNDDLWGSIKKITIVNSKLPYGSIAKHYIVT
jgi:hypothetical protein